MLKKFFIWGIVPITLFIEAFSVEANHNNERNGTEYNTKTIYEPIVVLELFTSQGCSSCPAADRLLKEVKQNYPDNVFTLSYHVDYWNYIGWDDPFSQAIYAKKQSNYNKKLKYRGNYTPEVVVNGKEHFTGSNRAKMNAAIKKFKAQRAENKVSLLKFAQKKETVTFEYKVEGNVENKNLRAVLVLDERITNVKRGENRNRTIENSNVVVAEKIVPLLDANGKLQIDVPNTVRKNEKLSLILLVSNQNLDITAAAQTKFVK